MFISELFEPGKDYEWQFRGSEEAMADFKVGNIPYRFYAFTDSSTPGSWEVEFKNNTRDKPMGRTAKFGLTGTGNAAEVMATVSDIMREFLQQYKGSVKAITFTADEASRKSLYIRMVKRLLPDWDLTVHDGNLFVVTAPEELAEYKEYPLEQFHGVTMKLKVDAHEVIVQALDDWDNVMGHARLNVGDLDELDPQDLSVDPRYQGQGIAKVMYDYLKSHGYEIHRSYDQTDAGAGFWNKHRGEERVWESENQTFSAKQVLDYVKKIHPEGEFNIDYVITDHPKWTLTQLPISKLRIIDPESEQEIVDPYNRVHDTNLQHVDRLVQQIASIIQKKPIVVDREGHVLDGNHRALAALKAGLKTIPAYVPGSNDYASMVKINDFMRRAKLATTVDLKNYLVDKWVDLY